MGATRFGQKLATISELAVLMLSAAVASGQVVINEIMYHPRDGWQTNGLGQWVFTANDAEFVEIYNAGSNAVDLSDYRFDNGIDYVFPPGVTLGTGEYLVVCRDLFAFTNSYPTVTNYLGNYDRRLANEGERLTLSRLVDGQWVAADTVKYHDAYADGDGFSLEMVNPGFYWLGEQCHGAWAASTTNGGTPGTANSVYNSNALPVLEQVRHEPALPPAGSSVAIMCRPAAREPGAVHRVWLLHRVDDQSPGGVFEETEMFDDGLNGDSQAGDGVYTRMMPTNGAAAMTNGAVLEFQINVFDEWGNNAVSPGTSAAGVVTGPYSYLCCFGDDTGFSGEYPTYHILMTESNRLILIGQTNVLTVYPLLDCAFITSDGEIFYNSGVRFRGSNSRRIPPFNYRVELPAGGALDDMAKFDFNHEQAANAYIGMEIARRSGYGCDPSHVQLCRLWLNGSCRSDLATDPDECRLYARVEPMNNDFMEKRYGDHWGNRYWADGDGVKNGDLSYYTNVSQYPNKYHAVTNYPAGVWADLSNLCWSVNRLPEELAVVITNCVNVRQWARHFAAMTAIDHPEPGYCCPRNVTGDELRLFADAQTGQFVIFAWDPTEPGVPLFQNTRVWAWNHRVVRNFLFRRPMVHLYAGDVLDIIQNVMTPDSMNSLFDEMGTNVNSRRSYWATRVLAQATNVVAYIKTNLTVAAGDTVTQGPLSIVVTNNSVSLSGDLPMNYTADIRVNGILAGWTPWNTNDMLNTYGKWATTSNVVLVDGANDVLVETLDSYGNVLRSETFIIIVRTNSTSTGGETIMTPVVWDNSNGIIYVTNDVTVQGPGGILTIEPDTTVLFSGGARINVISAGILNIQGISNGAPVTMFPSDGAAEWSIEASGLGSQITATNADLSGGRISVGAGTSLSIEGSSVKANTNSAGIIAASGAGQITLRRCIVGDFVKTTFDSTLTRIEECLFTNMASCGIEFAGGNAVVGRTTVRNSRASGADGIRLQGGAAAAVTNCLVRDVSGVGIRSVAGAGDVGVVSSLITGCATGAVFESGAVAYNAHNTIAACVAGLSGNATGTHSMIVWNNAVSVTNGPAGVSLSDIELPGTNAYPGADNMNRNPWFRDAEEGDYRLRDISPCVGGGSNGDMGASFPVGASPASPTNLTLVAGTNFVQLTWQDNSGGEEQWFEVQRSADGEGWAFITNLAADTTNYTDSGLAQEQAYRYRVRAGHERGESLWSEERAATTVAGTTIEDLRNYLRITELMYNPTGSGDLEEFIEIWNQSDSLTLDLSYLQLDNDRFVFAPGSQLAPTSFFVIARSGASFSNAYPGASCQGVYQADNGLDNNTETIWIKRIQGAETNEILSFDYDDDWYPTTDNGGYSLVLADPSGDPNTPAAWRPSTAVGGSPGSNDPPWQYGVVVINEVLTHQDTDNPGDWIELHNPGTNNVDIGYWYLSDSETDLKKFRFAAGTIVTAGSCVVFTEYDHFGTNTWASGTNGFALSELGETVYLSSGDVSGNLTSFRTSARSGAIERNITFGRHARSDGKVDFTALSSATRGATNAYPRVGPVVINEIMYNPSAGGKEFVELFNIASSNIALFGGTNGWRLEDGIEFAFPTNTWINTNESILVVSIEPDEFRQLFGLTNPALKVYGPFDKSLSNAGESIELRKPNPDISATNSFIIMDMVEYDDDPPWPELADNGGASLERRVANDYGNDPANWLAATIGGTPGTANNTNGLPSVAFTVPAGSVYESNGVVYVAVSLSPACAQTVRVDYAVAGGTAEEGQDYVLSPGAVVFWPNDTAKTIPLEIKDDGAQERDETAQIALTGASGALLGGNALYTCTIVDTDTNPMPAAPVISPPGGNFYTSVVVTVTCSATNGVVYYTTDGSIPGIGDTLYTGSFVLTTSARVTARTFVGSFIAGGWTNALFLEQTPPWQVDMATNNTPKWWLALHYPNATDFDAAALSDTDGDRMQAWAEYVAGTIPTNSESCFRITAITITNPPAVEIWFDSFTDRLYAAYWRSNLMEGVWTNPGSSRYGIGTTDFMTITDAPPVGEFYRLGVQLPP